MSNDTNNRSNAASTPSAEESAARILHQVAMQLMVGNLLCAASYVDSTGDENRAPAIAFKTVAAAAGFYLHAISKPDASVEGVIEAFAAVAKDAMERFRAERMGTAAFAEEAGGIAAAIGAVQGLSVCVAQVRETAPAATKH